MSSLNKCEDLRLDPQNPYQSQVGMMVACNPSIQKVNGGSSTICDHFLLYSEFVLSKNKREYVYRKKNEREKDRKRRKKQKEEKRKERQMDCLQM